MFVDEVKGVGIGQVITKADLVKNFGDMAQKINEASWHWHKDASKKWEDSDIGLMFKFEKNTWYVQYKE